MQYALKCSACNLPLTNQLEQLQHVSMLVNELEKDRVPVGVFGIEHGHFVVNLQDVINTEHHPDVMRLHGIELIQKIRKGQFDTSAVQPAGALVPQIWEAVLVA